MKFILSLVSVVIISLITANAASAQDVSSAKADGKIPQIPENYILDDTGFFRDHPEKLAEIRAVLQSTYQKHKYPVYVVICYSVFEGDLQNKANELHRAWIGEQANGMVLVYQRDPVADGSNPAIAFYQGSEIEGQSLVSELPDNLIPKRDTEVLLANVFRDLKAPPEQAMDYVMGIVSGIERELDTYFKVEPPKWNDSSNLRMMAIFAGTVAGLALLGMLFWKIFARADTRSSQSYYFPDVKTGRRLGAPYGGGWVSERKFQSSSSQE
ncbi:MAG: hypothetical protein AB8F34_05325 [Akkermansiaceae bacterium]